MATCYFLTRQNGILARFTFSAIVLLLSCHTALADWSSAGAQYSCSTKTATFTLLPHDASSEEENPPLEPGFAALPDGMSNLNCRLGKRKLRAQVGVTPPQSHGMCMGGGSVYVTSVIVDGVELLEQGIAFNWSCTGADDTVVKLLIRTKGSSVILEKCTIKETSTGNSAPKPTCAAKSFDVDAIAAANAKVDHQLADPKTQELHSATRLPPENDLAQVFVSSIPGKPEIPLCAHWSAVFLNAIIAPERQRHGRISGTKEERVYIHPANPQLCRISDDDGCKATAYLLPGDRVDVGFICGAWTQVQYGSRVRTKRSTKGWVETARLYDVDPVAILKASSSPLAPSRLTTNSVDPLLEAVRAKYGEEVNRLIRAGANPDGTNKFGDLLTAAIESDDVGMVRTLLQLGANVNAHPSNRKCRDLNRAVENEQIFDALVKAGVDLNCRDGQFGSTPLMDVAFYNRLWAWDRIHDGERASAERLRDPLLLAKRLLAAGSDPNAVDNVGQTALFYTMEANNIDVAQLLLDSGANPNISIDSPDSSYSQQIGSTPLMAAFHWYSLTFDPGMFQLLLTGGADANYRNQSRYNEEWDTTTSGAVTFAGQTVLTRAAQDGYFSLVRILLKHGVNQTISREDGALAETLAQKHDHPKIAALLASHAKKRPAETKPATSDGVQK